MGGVGPIPLSEIEAYLRIYGVVDQDEREEFVLFMQRMDAVYLQHHAEKAKKESAQPRKR
jgi:hypothetical protein